MDWSHRIDLPQQEGKWLLAGQQTNCTLAVPLVGSQNNPPGGNLVHSTGLGEKGLKSPQL